MNSRMDMSATIPNRSGEPAPAEQPRPDLPPPAQRALAEAEARRAERQASRPRELNGRGGLDPARYGDWEVKGVAVDF